MSRIGKLPVAVPAGVKATVSGTTVKIEGPKGSISKTFADAVKIEFADGNITVAPNSNSRFSRAMYGTVRSIINAMVEGVTKGFEKVLEIYGVGFKAELKGDVLTLLLGYAHPCVYKLPEGVTVVVGEMPDRSPMVTISGVDKHMVGQVAADLKAYYPVEPYKGKGVRIRGQYVRRKEGKKTA